jgi:DNA-binding transcriptional LysR family regulator
VPLLIAGDANLIATVPRELGRIFSAYKAIRIVDTPIALPRFALRQHWHPRYHHDEANSWLRKLIKDTFEAYPE